MRQKTIISPNNSTTADRLRSPQIVRISGDGEGQASFDGSAPMEINLTLPDVNTDVGTFGDSTHVARVTVNAKGQITAIEEVEITGGGGGGGGSGAFVYLGTYTPDDTNTQIDMDVSAFSTYHTFKLIIFGVTGGSNASLNIRYSNDAGATFFAGASDYKSSSSGAASAIAISGTVGANRQFLADLVTAGWNVGGSGARPSVTGSYFSSNSGGTALSNAVGGHCNLLTDATYNALRLFASETGALQGITAYLYGYKESNGLGGCQCSLNADQTRDFVTPAAIQWDGADVFDDGNYHDPSSNNTRLTVAETGVYSLTGNLDVSGIVANNFCRARIIKNGTDILSGQITDISDAVDHQFSMSVITLLSAGDYVELFFDTESDTSVTILAASSSFSIFRLS